MTSAEDPQRGSSLLFPGTRNPCNDQVLVVDWCQGEESAGGWGGGTEAGAWRGRQGDAHTPRRSRRWGCGNRGEHLRLTAWLPLLLHQEVRERECESTFLLPAPARLNVWKPGPSSAPPRVWLYIGVNPTRCVRTWVRRTKIMQLRCSCSF